MQPFKIIMQVISKHTWRGKPKTNWKLNNMILQNQLVKEQIIKIGFDQ